MGVKITDSELQKSAVKFRETLLAMPVLALSSTLQHMQARPGVRGREVVGQLGGDIQLAPYSATRVDKTQVTITPRTLETYLGSVVKEFEPNSVWQTVYGSLITKGEDLKNVNITLQVLAYLCSVMGANLNKVIFNAKRSDEGLTTKDLFNGFDTITKTEKDANKISLVNGNMYTIEAITDVNAVDVLKAIYRAADDQLQSVPTKMFIPRAVYNSYVDCYQASVGAVPYNTQFNKTFLEGSSNLCELVPLANKKDSAFIQLTTQNNMLVGYGNGGDEENITVEKYAPFILDFVATMFFGVQFESISKERLMVATIDGLQSVVGGK